MDPVEIYTAEQCREDLAKIIAQQTSGIVGVSPDPQDYILADAFIATIDSTDIF